MRLRPSIWLLTVIAIGAAILAVVRCEGRDCGARAADLRRLLNQLVRRSPPSHWDCD